MAMSNRAKYMQSLVADAFNLVEYEASDPFTKPAFKPMIDNWMKGMGPAQLFIYYQVPYKFNDSGEIDERRSGDHKEFFVTHGDKEKLRGKGLYFLRCTPPGKPINPQGTNDNEVVFGEISDYTISALNTIVNNVYKPLVEKLAVEDWGSCEDDQKKEFQQTFDKFAKELTEALESLNNKIELDKIDPAVFEKVKAVNAGKQAYDNHTIETLASVFQRWQEKIERHIPEATAGSSKDKDAGPVMELEYWKQRMRKLTGVIEQIRSRTCKAVFVYLDEAASAENDITGGHKDKISLETQNWKSIQLRVDEALNEAKDNVKYLQTLEKFLEPLYCGNPEQIIDMLPALMNSIKMIHTIARYYNTKERMTSLFVKITNQMILNCKFNIINFRNIKLGLPTKGSMGSISQPNKKSSTLFEDNQLWDDTKYPADELIAVLKSCQALKEAYIKQYNFTKERLESMPKAKQFDFTYSEIFGKFELFSRRVGKLIDLFSTIRQFKTLEKHNLENIQPIVNKFQGYVSHFRGKITKPLLDFKDDTFDRDFVEFNVEVSNVESQLQQYIDKNFSVITNIEDSLKLLRKFRSILHRDQLQAGLQSKYHVLLAQYSRLVTKIEDQFKRNRPNPITVRNLPIVSGSITWSRHLFHRSSVPMEHFPRDLLKTKDGKKAKVVQNHNNLTYNLFYYEYEWRQRWIVEVEKAKVGLLATLIIRQPTNNDLQVNFDKEIMTLIREAKCLSRIGIEIPESAKIVLLQEEKFKQYNNELEFVLGEYDRIIAKIRPNTKSLLVPHLEDLEYKLRPGMVSLTWTSMNIDGYLAHVHAGLSKLEQLIININDIMENRIENNLKALSKTVLVNLPQESRTYSLDEFVEMQERWIATESQKLKSKNYEVEQAVEDLIQTICSYQLDQHVDPICAEEIQKLSKYYSWSMYQALLHATKYSLNQMKERICGRRNAPKQILKPFFEVDVHLDGPVSTLRPSLDDVQSAINRAASHVLKSTKKVQLWFQKDQPEDEREPFYNWIAKDKEIVKVILLLTGSIQGTKNSVSKFLESFASYSWLWTDKAEDSLKKFKRDDPSLEDYEEKLKSFEQFGGRIEEIQGTHQIGALSLKTHGVKDSLKRYIQNWRTVFSKEIHKQAKTQMGALADDIKQIRLKIDKEVKDIDSYGSVILALEEIRKKQSNINFQFKPIEDMYVLIEQNLPNLDRDELDKKKDLQKEWDELVAKSFEVRNDQHQVQAKFKKTLILNIDQLVDDVIKFREDFVQNGPMKADLTPGEALNKLKDFKEQFSVHNRKYHSYKAGETLFALPNQDYPGLVKTQGELEKLDKLYTLYLKVTETTAKWQETPWLDITEEVEKMKEGIEQFIKDCQRLPRDAKQFPAYTDLKKEIDDMEELLPLVEMLADRSIKERHWEELIELTKKDIPYTSETFLLKDLLAADLLAVKEDIEDIADSANKQMKIEKQLREEIDAYWDEAELEIKPYQAYDYPCTIGGTVAEHQEKLEEHQMMLMQMAAMRQVTPFRVEVQSKIDLFASVLETLEKWLKVMSYWMSLVSVFMGGDIAKDMPVESKIFKTTDSQWRKIMERAAEQKNLIACCQNDLLVNSLPKLQEDLEICQKRLEGYLETKRGLFPRFYFCSNADLLKILSMGSDPHQVQDDFEKLFDAINRVTFDKTDRRKIMSIHQEFGGSHEDVDLEDPVKCGLEIEQWLCQLEAEMQKSMRAICQAGATECFSQPLLAFINKYQSQVALLGIQLIWTQKVTECLERQKDRNQAFGAKGKEIQAIMNDLTQLCRGDLPNNLQRTKVETLVTIHVYQKELFTRIQGAATAGRIKEITDFDWTRNTRVYWKAEQGQEGQIVVSITDVDFTYQYEFLGAKERLCITLLTERCYTALAQALGMKYGGSPAGPAGTGKTETVKDLGRTLGIFVVVTNCSGEHRFRDMAKIFKGLCQSGLWGCFDEFNRISLATLSVVAAQVESITMAKKQGLKSFIFPTDPDKPIRLIHACAYFITMNPGYAGRQELPENLKVLFRGVTMMVPNRKDIMKVKLASVGYQQFDGLDRKFNILYRLCEQQLSKQRHYDFGLRNILSVLRFAGTVLREDSKKAKQNSEEYLLASTLTTMNMSKFVMQDKSLFTELIGDIFPNVASSIKRTPNEAVEAQIHLKLEEKNLRKKDDFLLKIIQLYETSTVRHGFMVVGTAGCGKTTIYNVLTEALSNVEGNSKYYIWKMNPKAITGTEMYGVMNAVGEWEPGVFSEIWKSKNAKSNKFNNWINCDGPVDAIWIENLNTVLDDNKILTLANSERIPMSDTTKMTFEVENLRNASPATVSRNGIVFVSDTDLYWEALIHTWVADRVDKSEASQPCNPEEGKWVNGLITKYFKHKSFDNQAASNDPTQKSVFNFIRKNFAYVMETPEVVRIFQMLNLLTAMLQEYTEKRQEQIDLDLFEKCWTFSFAWAMGGLMENEDRMKFHKEVLERVQGNLPQISAQRQNFDKETIFDYYINPETRAWENWKPQEWTAPKRLIFSQLLIPTPDSQRAEFIIDKIASLKEVRSEKRKEPAMLNTLLVGGPGTAKTSIIIMNSQRLDESKMAFKRINFSYYTQPINFQESIDSEVEKKNAKNYRPFNNKNLNVFLDDISMPEVNTWGDQITLEITRQLMDQRGYYTLEKDERGQFKTISGLRFLAAMNHPGGGRNDVPNRLKRLFFSLNTPPPSNKAVESIYGRILTELLPKKKYSDEIVSMIPMLVDATISLWEQTSKRLLPTPTKFHYNFTIRELARVFGGIARVAQAHQYKVIANREKLKDKPDSRLFLVGLWRHEAQRTFVDKLITENDKKTFEDMLDKTTKDKFREPLGFEDEQLLTQYLFADFMRDDVYDDNEELVEEAPYVYEACPSVEYIKKRANERLAEFNEKYPNKKMDLVIFDDALYHLLRLTRVINSPSGHAMLVGVGGSGKQSLTRLAASIAKHYQFQITLSKTYNQTNFYDDVKALFEAAGPGGQNVTFLMTDSEIKRESFLEAINSLLSTGEIPGLLGKDDKELMPMQCKNEFMKAGLGQKGEDPNPAILWNYFVSCIKDRLHLVLAFSPVSAKFRERAQKFPSLFSTCSIDWFLPWPEEALISVSTKFLSKVDIDCKPQIKIELMNHMGIVHKLVDSMCHTYFQQMRRHVYVTPKSYLSFISAYQELYSKKYNAIDLEEQNITKGLDKLTEATADVDKLKDVLKVENVKLEEATESTNKLLKELEVENKNADVKSQEVNGVTIACQEQADQIEVERAEANRDLEVALPYLKKAEGAVGSIKQADITELKQIRQAKDIVRIIFDTVNILFMRELVPVSPRQVELARAQHQFISDSYDEYGSKNLTGPLLQNLLTFSQSEKDLINEETIELLEPYLTLKSEEGKQLFDPEIAKTTSAALWGLCTWAAAMSDYHKQSKIVKPKLILLNQKTISLQEARAKLQAAQEELNAVNELKAALKAKFDAEVAKKQKLADQAAKTRKKMDQANRLISSLSDNKVRWIENRKQFVRTKTQLVGDVAKACAFVSYCGPFNYEFRLQLTIEKFQKDLESRGIPCTDNLLLTEFLVDPATVGQWNLEGLPSDELSTQNGIMVTRSTRYPLMIDPQGQAVSWIKKREDELVKRDFIYTLKTKDLKDKLKIPLQDGSPCMIENIENEIDPMFDPILEKQYITKGRNKIMFVADTEMDYDDKFRLFLTSRLANPHFSPELAAKTTIIDFTVTQSGLESQLLGRLIGKEQKSLEDQLTQLQEDVTMNMKTLAQYEASLLQRLAGASGNLLDDTELIDVLNEIKAKAKEVGEKLQESSEKKIEINEKREQFRPVAARGAVLYFCIVEMSLVNWMYNTSLQQFLDLFDYGIDASPKSQLVKDRVANIIEWMTRKVYRYINRGLFEADKTMFKLQMCLKILIKAEKLAISDVNLMLKAGSGIDDRNKKIGWMNDKVYLNVLALSKHKFNGDFKATFGDIIEKIQKYGDAWKKFLDENSPEQCDIPDYQEKILNEPIGDFLQLCLIRCVREDRAVLASQNFVRSVLGDEFMAPVTDSIQEIWEESTPHKPVLFLLAPGSDPTSTIDELARKKKISTFKVSMGEEMDMPARSNIKNGFRDGFWVILNNCHLTLEFMAEMEEILKPKAGQEVNENFRLWITCEPNKEFPLGLLQMAIKVTTEPPKGIQAGIARTYSTMINQDFLERVEPYEKWRNIVFALCFMHSIVYERRKFGPLGFCIPYEFNASDLEASLTFIENHMTQSSNSNMQISWTAIRYMVCEVQYGGRITDDLDREMFATYGAIWLTEKVFSDQIFHFNPNCLEFDYHIPDCPEFGKYGEFINTLPPRDSPSIFGLNNTADLTFRLQESQKMLDTLIDTMPKEGGGSGGKTKEEEVKEKLENELIKALPENFVELDYKEKLSGMNRNAPKGLDPNKNIPLNVFLRQEIEQFQAVLNIVRKTMNDMVLAIEGTIIMTPLLVESIAQVFDFRVPKNWLTDPSGAEISWLTPTLGGWIKGLVDRHFQLHSWLNRGQRPASFWLTGFYNPQGFLTAAMQEVTRQNSEKKWSLDQVEPKTEAQKETIQGDDGRIDKAITPPSEGVFIHGLYLEGASWNKGRYLEDTVGKDLYFAFPIIHVTAVSTNKDEGANNRAPTNNKEKDLETQKKTYYHCPVYKYPKRNDKYLITRVYLKPDATNEKNNNQKQDKENQVIRHAYQNWTLKGVALLCTKE